MKLDSIELIFENCDSIQMNGEHINRLNILDIRTSVVVSDPSLVENYYYPETIVIQIAAKANVERYEFDQTDVEDYKQLVFDRITGCHDITGIDVKTSDDDHVELRSYCVPWSGDDPYINDDQKDIIDKDGNLCIVISENKTIEHFF